MPALYEWVRGIAGCMLLVTFVREMLPSSAYEPLLRVFSGMLLVLLVLRPVLAAGGLAEALPSLAEEIAGEWELEVPEAALETAESSMWQRAFAAEAEDQLKSLAQEAGVLLSDCSFTWKEGEPGRLLSLSCRIEGGGEEERARLRQRIAETFDIAKDAVDLR